MARKVLLAVVLLGVVAWTVMCGRSRSSETSDTPVPTLTSLPTSAPTATQTATAIIMPSPTVAAAAAVVPTVAATAVMTVATTAPLTTTVALTESATPTSTLAVVETPSITGTPLAASVAVTGATPLAETPSITTTTVITQHALNPGSTSISATAQISESRPSTITAQATAPAPSSSSEATSTVTVSITPTATAGVTPRVTAVITRSEASVVVATATPTIKVASTLTATVAVSGTATPTTTAEASVVASATVIVASTGNEARAGAIVYPRQTITLPAHLATSVQVTDVTLLTDLVANALPVAAELSPNGQKVAWIVPAAAPKEASLCVASLEGDGQNCFAAAGFEGMPYRLVWSPDSQWIAFSEDPAAQALESDIWLFDVAHGKLTNRTDDSMQGRFADATGKFTLDYLPMWDPATGLLYFWRSTPDAEGHLALDLMRLDARNTGEAETVRSFGQSLGDGLVRFGWQRFYLQGPSAISPDGSHLAVLISPAQEMDLSAKHALWLIDLENPQAEPQQLANSLSWQTGLPQWSTQPAIGRGVQWTEDGKGLVVAALSSDLRLPLLVPYYVDAASGKVTPVVDFSSSTDRDLFFRMDPKTLNMPRMDVPWTLAMAPNANVLLLVTDLAGGMRLLAAPLPPNGQQPMVVSGHRSPGFEAWTRSSGSTDGKVLVYGMLMRLTPN